MSLTKVIAISGKPGLYEIIGQTKGGFITTCLLDGKKTPITNTQNVSVLSDIGIYTYEGEIALGEVFLRMFEKNEGKEALSHKESNNDLVAYFNEILPEYDVERVYVSNIKKVIQWYNTLVFTNFDFEAIKEDLKRIEEARAQAEA